MKKILAVLFTAVMLLSLVACGENASSGTDSATMASQNEAAAEWEQFVADYEEWADKYVALYKKVQANPTDQSILIDYAAMAAEVESWVDRADKLKSELQDANTLAAFTQKLQKIAEKLTEVVE